MYTSRAMLIMDVRRVLYMDYVGGCQRLGALLGIPDHKDHGILWSILGPPILGKYHTSGAVPKSVYKIQAVLVEAIC